MNAHVLIVGASDQGQVVLDILRAQPGGATVKGFLDPDPDGHRVGQTVDGVEVLATLDAPGVAVDGVDGVVPAVGDGQEREHIAEVVEGMGLGLWSALHPRAHVAPSAEVEPGVVVAAGAIVGVASRLLRACIINTGAVVDHHCHVEPFAHVAPSACLAGHVTVGRRAWVGAGAVVREDLTVGSDSLVGAGAVVVEDVPAGLTVVGIPARPLVRQTSV